jgi:hypothetical protein
LLFGNDKIASVALNLVRFMQSNYQYNLKVPAKSNKTNAGFYCTDYLPPGTRSERSQLTGSYIPLLNFFRLSKLLVKA